MQNRIRIMTHNVWNKDFNAPDWKEKGEDCSAPARVWGLLRVYRETMPDIIGGQEFSALMADLVKQGFENENQDYALIWGRFTPILYRTDKFELIDSAFGTYPEKMEGFEGSFNDAKSKSWNLGVFRIKESGKCFIFATTHLWWKKSPENAEAFGNTKFQAGSDEARAHGQRKFTEVLSPLFSSSSINATASFTCATKPSFLPFARWNATFAATGQSLSNEL